MTFLGIFGGFVLLYFVIRLLVKLTNKTPDDTMIFPDDYYEQVDYFRLDFHKIHAVKKDGEQDEIHHSDSSTAQKYFKKIQAGFEDWIRAQRIREETTKKEPSKSKIKFT